MLKLPESVQDKVAGGTLSFSHARVLLVLPSQEEMEKAAGKILSLSLSVRQAETYVQGLIQPNRPLKREAPEATPVDPNVQDAQDRLQRALGLRVKIEDKNGRGRVIIEYARLEDFDTLMDQLAG
jgi:ParB family chromosome partitioning protein